MGKLTFKPISISLSPNAQKDDVFLAWKMLFWPWEWLGVNQFTPLDKLSNGASQRKSASITLEDEFKEYLGIKYAYSFNSGRSALMAILSALGIGEGDEVLIQAFTCNAVPNPILWSGVKPVYVDIDGSLNIDPDDLEKKITPKSKAIIVQHTFGIPAQMDKILTIAECYNLKVIEDCAHSLGAEYKKVGLPAEASAKAGTFGDIAFFSFGRDKIISSVYGGMVATNNPNLAEKIKEFQEKCSYPSKFWIFQQLLHPIIFSIALPTYYFLNIGKFKIWFCQKLRLLSRSVTKKEKWGENPGYFPQKMPNALAALALNQFKKLDNFNEHRREIAEFYNCETDAKLTRKTDAKPAYLKYPIFVKNPDKIRKIAKKNHILLDDGWWGSPVMPPGTNLEKMGYKIGDCPKAEKTAKTIINLPTHINISLKQAKKILNLLKDEKIFEK